MNRYLFFVLLAGGLCFRLFMLVQVELVNGGDLDVYLADEGVVGLMAKHIAEGRELPVFFYGQHYLGALEAYLAAVAFKLAGPSLVVLRSVPFIFSLLLAAAVYSFSYRFYSVAAARWATALVAVSPVYFLQWNLKARGGFIEHLVILFLVMLLFWRFYLNHERERPVALALGLVAGLAMWVNQLVMTYLIPAALLLARDRMDRRGLATVLAGFLVGASLLIGYNTVHPLATFKTLARKSVVLNRVPVEERSQNWLLKGVGKRVEALAQGADKLGLVFGVPPREGVERLGLDESAKRGGPLTTLRRVLAVFPAMVFVTALAACRPRQSAGGGRVWRGSDQLLGLFMLATFLVGYVSPRYMLAAYPLAAVMAGVLLSRLHGTRRRWMAAGVASVLVFNLLSWGDMSAAAGTGSAKRIERLNAALAGLELDRCYSAGPMYHAVFGAKEEIILAPLQKDRYPAYGLAVAGAREICYVFRPDQAEKRQHLAFMSLLERKNISFEQASTGDYEILYGFSPRRAITAADMDGVRG